MTANTDGADQPERLRVLAFSPEVGLPPVFASVQAKADDVRRLRDLLLRLRDVPSGSAVLAMLGFDGFAGPGGEGAVDLSGKAIRQDEDDTAGDAGTEQVASEDEPANAVSQSRQTPSGGHGHLRAGAHPHASAGRAHTPAPHRAPTGH